jgi:peptidoglycan/LPS O-acetylase OafA/YrhL
MALDRWVRRILVMVATGAATLFSFWFLIDMHPPPWNTTEYFGITFWSLPQAAIVLALCARPRRWLAGRSLSVRVASALGIAVVAALLWTFAAYFASGGYILAFDASPLYSWLGGAIAGCFVSLLWPDMGRRGEATAERASAT